MSNCSPPLPPAASDPATAWADATARMQRIDEAYGRFLALAALDCLLEDAAGRARRDTDVAPRLRTLLGERS